MREIDGATISIMIYSNGELLLISSESDTTEKLARYEPGSFETLIQIPAFLFNTGTYFFDVRIHTPGQVLIDHKQNIHFEILSVHDPRANIFQGNILGKIASILDYKTIKEKKI